MDIVSKWIFECAFLAGGAVYIHTIESRFENRKRLSIYGILFLLFCIGVNYFLPGIASAWTALLVELVGFLFLARCLYLGKKVTPLAAIYYAVWATASWQLFAEFCIVLEMAGGSFWEGRRSLYWAAEFLVFLTGYLIIAFTLGRIMPDKGRKRVGYRQLTIALVTFLAFQLVVCVPATSGYYFARQGWAVIYITQLLLLVILYLENELFKKSELRQELEMMNLLWQKEKEHYQLSRENIALINQKVHDLKHQVRALRSARREDIDRYLEEMEDTVQIYEAIVKTGNEALDTILTEKSLYCKGRGITVSCVADGSQLDFVNTVDLYAILGNAIDNAIEETEGFQEKEKRQIDVLIYRQQQFLAINIINPMKGKLVYEDELPVTTKGNKTAHGYGLRSIKYMLKKYDGFLSVNEADGCFSLLMLIPIPSPKTT